MERGGKRKVGIGFYRAPEQKGNRAFGDAQQDILQENFWDVVGPPPLPQFESAIHY